MKSHVRVRQKVYQVIPFEGNEVVCGYILAAQYGFQTQMNRLAFILFFPPLRE